MLEFTLSIPTDYELATTGSTIGSLVRQTSTNIPYTISTPAGNTLFLGQTLDNVDRNALEGARISPNANGFPETTVVGRPGFTLNVNDGSIFPAGANIYIVSDVNPTTLLFDLAGSTFGTLMDACLLYTSPSPRD